MQICETKNCVGCFSCLNVCAKQCITMQENEIGHIYPKVDETKCVNCGACKTVCPANTEVAKHTLKYAAAAYSLDETIHIKSTSGGVATTFSKFIVENGGVVYGSSSKIESGVSHIRVDCVDELDLLQGSKYVHSYINDCYKDAKRDLESGKQVLFTGTPCQIAGLKAYLKKDYENLITVDLICHGVPPQKLLFDNLKKYDVNGKFISFRESDGYFLKIEDSDSNLIYRKTANKDLYFLGFNKSLFFRDSCYSCKFADSQRCSDITIGDFWGLGKKQPFNGSTKNGVSVVMPNTERGMKFWNNVSGLFFFEERPFDEAVLGNWNLKHPTVPHKNKEKFANIYSKKGFKKSCIKLMIRDILKHRFFNIIYRNKIIMKIVGKIRK